MIIYKKCTLPNNLEKHIIEDSNKEFKIITSYTLVNGCVDGYFYKKITMPKVRQRYDGNYVKLLLEYYQLLSKIIKCNELVEIFEYNGDVYEVSNLINSKDILCDNNNVTYEEIKKMLAMALEGIEKLEYDGDKTLGIDSAIWNYAKDGTFFDYDPPKLLRGESLFITSNDDYRKRVLYRNFNYNGMRANTLGTVFLGNENWNFNITHLSNNYVMELIDIFFSFLTKKEDIERFKNDIFGSNDINEFNKHPINIIRKQLRK